MAANTKRYIMAFLDALKACMHDGQEVRQALCEILGVPDPAAPVNWSANPVQAQLERQWEQASTAWNTKPDNGTDLFFAAHILIDHQRKRLDAITRDVLLPMTTGKGFPLNPPPGEGATRADLLAIAEAGVNSKVSEASMLEFHRTERFNLTRTDFARVLGLALSHYSEVINGKRRLPINSVARAVAIGMPAGPFLAHRSASKLAEAAQTEGVAP